MLPWNAAPTPPSWHLSTGKDIRRSLGHPLKQEHFLQYITHFVNPTSSWGTRASYSETSCDSFFFRFFFFFQSNRPTDPISWGNAFDAKRKKGRWPYTNWDSFTPRKYKINLIRTFTYRCYQERISCCYQIFSSSSLLQSALNDLRKLPLQNGYPQGIINFPSNDLLERNRNKQSRWPCTIPMVPKKDVIILLLYLGHYPVMTTLC